MPNIDIPFSAGIDNKTSPLLAEAPSLLIAQNVIYAEGGVPSKRNGYGVLPRLTRRVSLNLVESSADIIGRATLAATASIVPGLPVAGYAAWYKADANTYSDNGTTPCANGDPVQQWNDQSVTGYNLLSLGVRTADLQYERPERIARHHLRRH